MVTGLGIRRICRRQGQRCLHLQLLQSDPFPLERQVSFRPWIPVLLVADAARQCRLQASRGLVVAPPARHGPPLRALRGSPWCCIPLPQASTCSLELCAEHHDASALALPCSMLATRSPASASHCTPPLLSRTRPHSRRRRASAHGSWRAHANWQLACADAIGLAVGKDWNGWLLACCAATSCVAL